MCMNRKRKKCQRGQFRTSVVSGDPVLDIKYA